MSNNEAIIRTAEQPNSRTRDFSLKSWLKKYWFIRLPLLFLRKWLSFFFWFIPFFTYSYVRKLFIDDIIFTRCQVNFHGCSITTNPGNYGDDLNKYLFEYVTGKKVVPLRFDFPSGRYIMIGSILGSYCLTGSIVYGTGIATATSPLHGKPDKIISVRGPLTRQVLNQKNIECPENYGDPALLLPMFYKPSVHKHKFISIIPHGFTMWEPFPVVVMEEFITKHKCQLINITRYENWTDVIDAIASSILVISESLHGLIIAETYNIPSIWVEFINHDSFADWSFKFRDFYESIGKYNMTSIKLYEGYDFGELLKLKDEWRPGRIDYAKLLKDFPFTIRQELRRTINFPVYAG